MPAEESEELARSDGRNVGIPLLGSTVTCATASADGLYIAALASGTEIHIIQTPSYQTSATCHPVPVSSKPVQKVLAHARLLRWGPEYYALHSDNEKRLVDHGEIEENAQLSWIRVWLLVSDGRRLVILSIDLDLVDTRKTACIVSANYDLGEQYNDLSMAEFVFSHQYALVVQPLGLHASILSLSRPERRDIPNVKFADQRSLAISPKSRRVAVLTRVEGQDHIIFCHLSEVETIESIVFHPTTLDAQELKWSPANDPLLCVWDSSSYGINVCFFTATGHHLVQMDITSQALGLQSSIGNGEGLGINSIIWTSWYDTRAMLAIFDVSGRLVLLQQLPNEKFHSSLFTFEHDRLVEGTTYQVWQESQEGLPRFTQHSTIFEPRTLKTSLPPPLRSDLFAHSYTGQHLATKCASKPWTLWIWDKLYFNSHVTSQPTAVINFRHRIEQLLWHPTKSDVLIILTAQERLQQQQIHNPWIYVFHASERPGCATINAIRVPLLKDRTLSTNEATMAAAATPTKSHWEATWVASGQGRGDGPLWALLVSSEKAFSLGTFTARSAATEENEDDGGQHLQFESLL